MFAVWHGLQLCHGGWHFYKGVGQPEGQKAAGGGRCSAGALWCKGYSTKKDACCEWPDILLNHRADPCEATRKILSILPLRRRWT